MSGLLEVIIGIVFVFLVFSLITSWVVEYISARKNRRGELLYKYLTRVLDDPLNANVGQLLYQHPLIQQLMRERDRSGFWINLVTNTLLDSNKRNPQYIPSEQFSAALIDVIAGYGESIVFEKSMPLAESDSAESPLYRYRKIDINISSFSRFIAGLDHMNESELRRTLMTHARKAMDLAGWPIDTAHQQLEAKQGTALNLVLSEWYNNSMDRMSGWYKRRTRRYLLITGFVVAALFNVDAIDVVNILWSSSAVRAATVMQAEELVKRHASVEELQHSSHSNSQDAYMATKIDSTVLAISSHGLPVGWQRDIDIIERLKFIETISFVFKKHWLGWVLSAIAFSFGAPFWFDALKQFINVRSTGSRPQTGTSH